MAFFAMNQGWNFVRRNPVVFYSFFLVVSVTGALFLNTYYFLGKFEESTDNLLQSKAFLSESVFGILTQDMLSRSDLVQSRVEQLQRENSDVSAMAVLTRSESERSFHIAVSTIPEERGSTISFDSPEARPFLMTWNERRAIGYITSEDGKRYWNVVKAIDRESGERIGLVLFQLSLDGHDRFVAQAMRQVYIVALVSLLFVLGLMVAHMRLYGFAIKATKLEEVDRMKDDFISMASHELRSPLTVLKGYADILKDRLGKKVAGFDQSDEGTYLSNMTESVNRLSNLVEDILNVSRIEQNRLPVSIDTIDIVSIVKKTIDQFELEAKQKGLTVLFDEMVLPKVSADADRVTQILVNLVSNAIKYTPKGGIRVIAKESGKYVLVTVADTGLGISAEGMKNLFSKFYRVKTDETVKISGTGLGLWISREIARKMGGDLSVESIEGIGSHFTLHLKKALEGRV